jgi:hypothetical protein
MQHLSTTESRPRLKLAIFVLHEANHSSFTDIEAADKTRTAVREKNADQHLHLSSPAD